MFQISCLEQLKWMKPISEVNGKISAKTSGTQAQNEEDAHRLVNCGKRRYSNGKGNQINGLEGFWGYLKRKLAYKGGIRQEKLPLYLGGSVWLYKHRNNRIRWKWSAFLSCKNGRSIVRLPLYPIQYFFIKNEIAIYQIKSYYPVPCLIGGTTITQGG